MNVTITLKDGDHTLTTPTFYALQLMQENGADLMSGNIAMTPAVISGILAALLTDSEPLNGKGEPERVWTPVQTAKLIDPANLDTIGTAITDLMADAFPDAVEVASDRPTKA